MPNLIDLNSVSSTKVSSDFAYVGSDLDEVIHFDLQVRKAICRAVKAFIGQDVNLDSAMTEELWERYDIPCSLFVDLSCVYSNRGLGAREFRQRPLIESLITFVGIEATMGDEALKVLLSELVGGIKMSEAWVINKIDGEPRFRAGIEMLKLTMRVSGGLPANYRELEQVHQLVKRRAFPQLLKTLIAPKKTMEEIELIREAENAALVTAVSSLREKRGIEGIDTTSLLDWFFKERTSSPR